MLSTYLRASMSSRHKKIEQHPLQNELTKGTITKERYVKYLQGMLGYHRNFEAALKEHSNVSPLKELVDPDFFMVPRLEADLKELNAETNGKETSVSKVPADSPLELLGVLYVLIGSKHGGKFMSKALTDKWGAEYHHYYLDPFDTKLAAMWLKFTKGMDDYPMTREEQMQVLRGAISAYDAFTLSSDLAIA